MLSDLRYRLRALVRRGRLNAELDEELRDHVESETEKYVRSGTQVDEARRKALIALGGIEQTRQWTREVRGTRLIDNMLQDLRYSVRSLAKNRVFTAVVILTLALGIGSCTAIFSLMVAVMFPPVPFGDAGRLVYVTTPNRDLARVPPEAFVPNNADFADLRRETRSLSAMTQFSQKTFKLDGTAISIDGGRVDADFFATLQTRPELGRGINSDDNQPGNDSVVVISFSLWQQSFGEDRAVLGKSLQLDGKEYHIIGVMAPGFNFPRKMDLDEGDSHIDATDVWIPLALAPKQLADRGLSGNCYALGRLKDGVSVTQAEKELSAIMKRLDPLHDPRTFAAGWYAFVKPYREQLEGSTRPLMWLLMGSVAFVLLIACENAANLLLARGANRTHELGVRAALGAGRRRLIRQMMAESLLLGISGGLAGIGLAWVFLRLLLRLDPGNIPRLNEASLNGRVLSFTVATMLLTSILTGMMPALSSSRVNLTNFFKSSGHRGTVAGRNRLRSSLIVSEVAIVVVLLAGAGLLLRSYIKLEQVPTGFSSTTLSMKIDLPGGYSKPEQRRAFYRSLLAQLASVRGISAQGAVDNLPFGDTKGVGTFWVEGYSNQKGQMVDGASVTPEYFSAMNTPFVEGRQFTESDVSEARKVAVINQAFANQYFAGQDPIGKWILPEEPDASGDAYKNARTVVGVVADMRDWSMEERPQAQLYAPMAGPERAYVVIRSLLPREDVANSAKAILHRIDANLAFIKIRTMRELVSESTARRRFQVVLLTIFAGMALVLALVGFYGLLTYSVNQRSGEMGVRIALGATKVHVIQLVLRQGLQLVSIGLVLGLVAGAALTKLLTSSLYGVSALDPITFAAVPSLLLITTFAACLIPARRAANADPMNVLRCE